MKLAKYFRWWWGVREPRSPKNHQLVSRERKAEKGSIDFMLNRPPSLPFLAALALMGADKGLTRVVGGKTNMRHFC